MIEFFDQKHGIQNSGYVRMTEGPYARPKRLRNTLSWLGRLVLAVILAVLLIVLSFVLLRTYG